MPVPFLLVGDHPALPSGLGRILRDLAQQFADDAALDLDVRIVGCRPGGTGEDGCGRIPVWSFLQSHDAASEIRDQVHLAWQHWWDDDPGVVLSIWDAQRISALVAQPGPWEHWAYVPIDAAMIGGGLRGGAAATLASVDRLLAYGGYGHDVLDGVRPNVPYLPHGLDQSWWIDAGVPRGQGVIGCVMTNQPRKDWATALATIAELRRRGHKVKLWAHTDRLDWPWDLPQLIELYGLRKVVQVTLAPLSDVELQRAYQQCVATILPSLGEGFGYPLIESLASGVPCVHTTFGGGAEWVPRPEWKVPERGRRVEGNGIERPVLWAEDFANALEQVWTWQGRWDDRGAGYCRGAIQHLQWSALYPRWRSWIHSGLEAR